MARLDGRKADQIRPVSFDIGYIKYPEGSVLITAGNTKVLCNATIEAGVPAWMKQQGRKGGWITAEYSMLPRSTHTRSKREAAASGSRSQEIRRLVGRALRAAVRLEELGERTITVDCDVIQADGGTRTASITGGFVALSIALQKLAKAGEASAAIIETPVAAISAGIVDGEPLLDLCYEEDVRAESDANFVMGKDGKIIEIQCTAEKALFSRDSFSKLLDLSETAIAQLIRLQTDVLAG